MHVVTVERKNSLLTRRNLQQNQNRAQCERPSATTDWGIERTEQTEKEHRSTDPGVLCMRRKSKMLLDVAPLVVSSRRERQMNSEPVFKFRVWERAHTVSHSKSSVSSYV
ncbi:hypothetical protein ATANTOWER_010453 [Ataeniobius toweri]|uniref:Uncharacterized protein n=1 Tax=Ataeniobius toweri TaxID=208326 RepID=A0ABU7APX1_9TELE|nr:hypothetical protein [Ataeniobius toweri]